MSEKTKTTIYINKKILKKIKMMVIDRDKTNVESVTHAVDWGLKKLIKRKKI